MACGWLAELGFAGEPPYNRLPHVLTNSDAIGSAYLLRTVWDDATTTG